MKVRWREHELIFVTILVAVHIIIAFLQAYNPSYKQPGIDFAYGFKENGLSFIYWRNVLIPRVCSVLLIYLGYLSINLIILPLIKKISFTDFEKLLTINIVKPVLAMTGISYFLAIGSNAISYYARPHLFNYGGYQILALFGYNDKPLTNLFSGFERAMVFVLILTSFAGLRQLAIWLIDRPGTKRSFRVLIINNLTPLLFIYLLIPFLTDPLHETFIDYVAWATPVLALYIHHTFWLFPLKERRSWLSGPVLIRLLTSTFAGALFFTIVYYGSNKLFGFSLYWLFLLFIVTPLCWLLYQQRKEKIIQLRGMETALAKSTAKLQFLRSQINPHFLFNALNTLYGTAIKENAETTAQGIQQLGDMMRFMLHENNLDFISMAKEIDYLKNYISLQKLRIQSSPNISIEDNIEEAGCNRLIAPMLLIPFVENAFKHGISLNKKSWITIKLECVEKIISFEVRNSVHQRPEADTEKDKSGIGLRNVAERLKLLYPTRHELEVIENKNEFMVKLILVE